MLTHGGVVPIGGAVPSRASEPTLLLVLGSGGAERGIHTGGIQVGILTGTLTRTATTATGTAADAGAFPEPDFAS